MAQSQNSLRNIVDVGDVAFGAETKTRSLATIETFGDVGLDFVWVDLEHTGPSPYDSDTLENFVRAAEISGTEIMVRLPSGEPDLIRKVLDAGIRNILIPRLETASQVKRVVTATRYEYEGQPGDRGVGTGRSSRWGYALDGYTASEDRSVMIGVMIENQSAIENIEEILAVPELGFIFIGPADLSVSLGVPLQMRSEPVMDAISTIREHATDAGVPVGRIANDIETIEESLEDGYSILRIGSELDAARVVLGNRLNEVKSAK